MDIKIYTKPNCVFSRMAKWLMDDLNVKYEEIDVQLNPKMMDSLKYKTVPQIYVWNKYLWWYSDISDMNDDWVLLKELWLEIEYNNEDDD